MVIYKYIHLIKVSRFKTFDRQNGIVTKKTHTKNQSNTHNLQIDREISKFGALEENK